MLVSSSRLAGSLALIGLVSCGGGGSSTTPADASMGADAGRLDARVDAASDRDADASHSHPADAPPRLGSDATNDGSCGAATTCAKAGASCGPIGDGCGGTLQCGDCPAGQTCGGGGTPSACGAPVCAPQTCAALGANCGPVGDGCGGQLACGTCPSGQTCGGGGTSSVCGAGPCTAETCAQQDVNCGPVGDGCGGVIQCGTCTAPETCGGGSVASVCGAQTCVPKTCAGVGANCGPIGDGCGNLLECGTCSLPDTCGGAGTASACGVPAACTGLCLEQTTCANPAVTTTVTGTVFAPNGVDPLPNALVYVPNAAVSAFTPGVSCDQCGAPASGAPLVSAVTAVNGTFTLHNMPVGANIPLVVQLGRWRRQFVIPTVASCTNTAIPTSTLRMPSNHTEGDIPLMAFATGSLDALECVMRKIGIEDTEFTAPGGGGRINLYEGLNDTTMAEGAMGGAKLPTSPTEDQLWGTQAALNQYDVVFFPCQGNQTTRTAAVQQNLINYANAGGRVFATHFSYVWLDNDAPFSTTASWEVEQHPSPPDQTGYIDQTFPKGQLLAQWLMTVGASFVAGQIPLQVLRHDENGPIAPAQSWMTINDTVFPGADVDYTFNTPIGAPPAEQCGRVLFDDFHVENVANSSGMIFPAECVAGAMTAQEKLLEFMIFDLSSCVTPDTPPACVPHTCAGEGITCGPTGDGCGGLLECGACPAGQTCGGGGTPSQCGVYTCAAETCAQQGIGCGPAGDGCGNEIACGACPMAQTCGGGGKPGVCGSQPCTPQTCAEAAVSCGPVGDGCGGVLQCGTCPAGDTCGGGGTPGACGTRPCTPLSCTQLGVECGPVGDGCGNVIQCGACSAPQTCGGGGTASVCGGSGPK